LCLRRAILDALTTTQRTPAPAELRRNVNSSAAKDQ
jgi:hypothetical protein